MRATGATSAQPNRRAAARGQTQPNRAAGAPAAGAGSNGVLRRTGSSTK